MFTSLVVFLGLAAASGGSPSPVELSLSVGSGRNSPFALVGAEAEIRINQHIGASATFGFAPLSTNPELFGPGCVGPCRETTIQHLGPIPFRFTIGTTGYLPWSTNSDLCLRLAAMYNPGAVKTTDSGRELRPSSWSAVAAVGVLYRISHSRSPLPPVFLRVEAGAALPIITLKHSPPSSNALREPTDKTYRGYIPRGILLSVAIGGYF